MVYADVTVSSKQKPSLPSNLDLDDSRVQYSQIDLKMHMYKDKMVKPQTSPMMIESDPAYGIIL